MLTPLLFRVIVKPFDLADTDPTYKKARELGIEIVDGDAKKRDRESVDRGTVVSVGNQAFNEWTQDEVVKVGDEVFYAKYAGKKIKDPFTGEEFLVLNDEDIVVRATNE